MRFCNYARVVWTLPKVSHAAPAEVSDKVSVYNELVPPSTFFVRFFKRILIRLTQKSENMSRNKRPSNTV